MITDIGRYIVGGMVFGRNFDFHTTDEKVATKMPMRLWFTNL